MASTITKLAGAARQTRILAASVAHHTCRNRVIQPACFISTSKKNKDSASASITEPMETPPKGEEMFSTDPNHEKNWISFGFSLVDKEYDQFAHNITMFLMVSMGICWTVFTLGYMPDNRLEDWAQREAFLTIAQRDKEGLPMIDCEYISDTSKIVLPSDEELGDTEIII